MIIKRIFDVFLVLILFFILSPLMFIISVLIKLESKGPVIFKQKRIGRNETAFYIYKFRTMVVGTPDLATDKLINREKYVTRIGTVLRKTSLDELPNLFNIIKGEMSFVGPRPALYNQYELIQKRREKGINNLLPGLTGLAQVNGRDQISDEEKVLYDERYLKNRSLIQDIKVLLDTISSVASGKNIVG